MLICNIVSHWLSPYPEITDNQSKYDISELVYETILILQCHKVPKRWPYISFKDSNKKKIIFKARNFIFIFEAAMHLYHWCRVNLSVFLSEVISCLNTHRLDKIMCSRDKAVPDQLNGETLNLLHAEFIWRNMKMKISEMRQVVKSYLLFGAMY